jgi:hypothetical protein
MALPACQALAILFVWNASAFADAPRLVQPDDERQAGASGCPDEAAIRAGVAARLVYEPFRERADDHLRATEVPDGTGLLRCYTPPTSTVDGGFPSRCVPSAGPCTINADCCVGSVCIQPQGSTQGICGLPTPPPGTPGTDAGTPDVSSPGCAEYGQVCSTSADCCNGVTCWNGRCMAPIIP